MQHINTTITTAAVSANQYLDIAFDIAIHLARTAIWDGNRCNWVGSAVEPVQGTFQMVEKACAADLYNGTSGIALFLSLVLQQRHDEILMETLEGTINHVLGSGNDPASGSSYAYYSGETGIANTLIDIGTRMKRKDWIRSGWTKLLDICRRPVLDTEVDIISGAAGAIPVLIRLYEKNKHAALREAIVRCGDFLIEKADKTETCWWWRTIDAQQGMTGYSHGAAGIAAALLDLYKFTGFSTYYTAAMMGFNFERMNFNAQLQNWPDFRNLQPGVSTQLVYGESWCHGAPGIALSRLKAWKITNDASFKQEAEAALATTYRGISDTLANSTASSNFSICHGLAGNADILIEGSNILNNNLYLQVAKETGNYGMKKYYRNMLAWPSGVNDPSGLTQGMGETPGLMLGLAGTGYFYLRISFPQMVKSVLLL